MAYSKQYIREKYEQTEKKLRLFSLHEFIMLYKHQKTSHKRKKIGITIIFVFITTLRVSQEDKFNFTEIREKKFN